MKYKAQFVKLRRYYDHIIFDGLEIGDSGNSGFQTLNIAAKRNNRIVLIGFDMRLDGGVHWHGRYPKGMHNPAGDNFMRWRNVLNAEAPRLRDAGLEVYRESDRSLLINYPVLSIGDALAKWL